MISGIRFKVCGLRTLADAELADSIGADWLGFIFHEKSPRYVSFPQWEAMRSLLPDRRCVAVAVMPSCDDLRRWQDGGIDRFQLHFPADLALERLAEWSAVAGPENLWLAPKLPPGTRFRPEWLEHGRTVLVDTYSKDAYGGTGLTGDWNGFRSLQTAHPSRTWILAGGLAPENVIAALDASGARVLDVNSGVEAAPGIKDPARLRAWADALRGYRRDA
ncbi:phosphoribosylanthranilate isomerase [Opitutales bacterium ASA1]|uniref:phosphoribosylanthranilate isomerase n=1 Tax=Congregicoccus parvus TaxID=3081749 RepID=UPI002B281F5A|nr:phosphoribosylanthranilate isomerase [Opitutales bacterium ASA1]